MTTPKPYIFLVISAKGGIGASIMATTFSSVLSELSRTLYIDIDNGYSFSKDDINQSGNTKLDLLNCDLSNINELLQLAKPLYNYIVLDVKSFFGTKEIVSLINQLSALSCATIVPVSTSELDLLRTKEFLSVLTLADQTKTVILNNQYHSSRAAHPTPLSICLPEKRDLPNLIISDHSFPIIKTPANHNTSNQIKTILNDLIPDLF